MLDLSQSESFTYTEVTEGVQIEVTPHYVEEQSNPTEGHFFYAYKVVVVNNRPETIQLVSRHWIITDGEGKVEEVSGPGVVGIQPNIETGKSYSYTSFCPLPTPTGNMRGSYSMRTESGLEIKVRIPLFFLRANHMIH